MIKPKIGLDWDDVTAPFNSIAIEMANNEYNIVPPLTLEDIESWENTGRASVIKKYYADSRLYEEQSKRIKESVKNCIYELMNIADVYFITAVSPEFMSVRSKQIMEAFPTLPTDRIILGAAKHLVQFDIVLDDNICNVLNSPAEYPVLMRKPWNRDMTGLLSVNNMEEFVLLVKHICTMQVNKPTGIAIPSVIALVGPSGSGKTQIMEDLLSKYPEIFKRPVSYTTNPNNGWKVYIDEKDFSNSEFLESTRYAGYGYGTKREDIESILSNNQCVIMPLDMCGAIGMKKLFPTEIIYINKGKMELIRNIVSETYVDDEEKTLRILSLDAEKKNEAICDYTVSTDEEIVNLISIGGIRK